MYHKVYNTLCPANSYNANLGRAKIINKDVIKLHKQKRKRKEIQQHTERKTPHTNSSTVVLLLEKKRLKLQLEVYTTHWVNFLKYSILYIGNIQKIIFIV